MNNRKITSQYNQVILSQFLNIILNIINNDDLNSSEVEKYYGYYVLALVKIRLIFRIG